MNKMNTSLETRIENQLAFLKKKVFIDDDFEETIHLIEDMHQEIINSSEDIKRFNAIAIELEKKIDRLKAKQKQK